MLNYPLFSNPEEQRIHEQIKAEGKERMSQGGKGVEIMPHLMGKSRDLIGKRYNVNGRHISDLESVAKAIASLDELEKRSEAEWSELVVTRVRGSFRTRGSLENGSEKCTLVKG